MWTNLPIYLICIAYLGAAGYLVLYPALLKRRARSVFFALSLPSFLMVAIAVIIGYRGKPDHELVIHGYRVDLPENGQSIYVGSDPADDLYIHHRLKDQEAIAPGLLEINARGTDGVMNIAQVVGDTRNVISLNGKPMRSHKLELGTKHQIQFGAFEYSRAPKDVLRLEIPGERNLGPVSLATPEFEFRGVQYQEGFSHQIGWFLSPLLPNLALKENRPRHLAWNDRIRHSELNPTSESLLRQASLIKKKDGWYLAANDADIQLDGRPFPTEYEVRGSAKVSIESHQLGSGRKTFSFRVYPPTNQEPSIFFELTKKRRISLPGVDVADRICLTRSSSGYSAAYDILDDRFPKAGMIISREGERFVFRGQALELNKTYRCGQVLFTLERPPRSEAYVLILFAYLFFGSVFLFPRKVLEIAPMMGILVSTGLFLHALRVLFAFRAWQGPPFSQTVFMDSLIAPYFFVLGVVVLGTRHSLLDLVRAQGYRVWNFLVPQRRRQLPPKAETDCSEAVVAVIAYGLLLWLLFPNRIGLDVVFVILFFIGIAFLLPAGAVWERQLSRQLASTALSRRYAPLYGLLIIMLLAMVAAPLMGGREIIPFLPGRPRPDIFIQLALLLVVAYQAALWDRERTLKPTALFAVFGVYLVIFVIPLIQGGIARDLGFFVIAALPLLGLLLIASWNMDPRLKSFFVLSFVLILALPALFKSQNPPLDSVAAQRLAFWIDKPRLKSEHFFDYQAQVPILWSSSQGLTGGGYFQGDWYSALSSTSVNDNVASVFIQGELGAFGSILIMSLYGLIGLCSLMFLHYERRDIGGFRIWIIYGGALIFIWTATCMFLQNFGYLPLTGKNLPFLGLDTKNDVIRYSLLMGLMVRSMRFLKE